MVIRMDKMKTLQENELNSNYVAVAIIAKKYNVEDELEMLFTKNTSVSRMVDKFNLTRGDFSLWSNYGNDTWLVIEKSKVDNTYFMPRTFLFLQYCEIGDKIDFGDKVYQLDYIDRKPSIIDGQEDLIWTSIYGKNIKKDGKIGKLKVNIAHRETILNNAVEIDFSR